MQKFIATTTINPPTKALLKFIYRTDWEVVITGDLKTPHKLYRELEKNFPNITYLSPHDQRKLYPKLSKLIGWRCIQRRNISVVHAYRKGADVIALIDDDNIPYNSWGENLLIGKKVRAHYYETEQPVFDPLSATNRNKLWHRGFPIELVKGKNRIKKTRFKKFVDVLVQADLWDGEADVDAIERISLKTKNMLRAKTPYASNKLSPFNSQNTFLARKVIPDFFLFPHVGRLDDIWGSYYLQHKYPGCVVYNKPSVFQERNAHNLFKDMDKEWIGYKHSLEVATNPKDIKKFLPKKSWEAFMEYRKLLKK